MGKSFGLYIHIPFCKKKCYYCDFNSITIKKELVQQFLAALKKEIKLIAKKYQPQIETIYIGGGTPTILSGLEIANILKWCQKNFRFRKNMEITIEANPGTLTKNKLKVIKSVGVNRLSLGVQSFNNQLLERLGRIHTRKEVIDSYHLAREVGFKNISFDLMFVLPGQSVADWRETLLQTIELGPEHCSTYNLKIEPGTRFNKWLTEGKITKPNEELDLKMYQLALELLVKNDYRQYEISNFSKPGYNSQHNQIYWKNEPYLALGPGAHFYDGEARGYNLVDIEEYCNNLENNKLAVATKNKLSEVEKIEDTMMLGLRLNKGISLKEFENRFQKSLVDIYDKELNKLKEQKLIMIKKGNIRLTGQGRKIANQVLAEFLRS